MEYLISKSEAQAIIYRLKQVGGVFKWLSILSLALTVLAVMISLANRNPAQVPLWLVIGGGLSYALGFYCISLVFRALGLMAERLETLFQRARGRVDSAPGTPLK